MNTLDLFQSAQLAEAAYGNFVTDQGNLINVDTDVVKILQGLKPDGSADPKSSLRFSETQAQMFVEQWSVVEHQENTGRGFSLREFQSSKNQSFPMALKLIKEAH